jgi:hypothetical protein
VGLRIVSCQGIIGHPKRLCKQNLRPATIKAGDPSCVMAGFRSLGFLRWITNVWPSELVAANWTAISMKESTVSGTDTSRMPDDARLALLQKQLPRRGVKPARE